MDPCLNTAELAATLDFMQITSLDDNPSEEVLPASLVDSTAPVQQKFLKDLACKIVDTYIINKENINALKEKLKKERSIDTGLLANGRFGCRFPGCTKSFIFDGRSRIAHEKTHGMHCQPSALPIPTSVANVKDDVRNYQLALLEYVHNVRNRKQFSSTLNNLVNMKRTKLYKHIWVQYLSMGFTSQIILILIQF